MKHGLMHLNLPYTDDAPKSVLLVDDNQPFREYARFILESGNYCVDEASSCEEGLKLCDKKEYSVVLTDIVMPGKSGISMIKSLRVIFPYIAIIIMSGIEMCKNLYGNAYIFDADLVITKPFTAKELLCAIERVQLRCRQKI
jgi:CheY-like chemotaxis protein